MDSSKLIEFRYQLWSRMCALADEAMSLADAWLDSDPDLVELHHRRCSIRQYRLFEEEDDGPKGVSDDHR